MKSGLAITIGILITSNLTWLCIATWYIASGADYVMAVLGDFIGIIALPAIVGLCLGAVISLALRKFWNIALGSSWYLPVTLAFTSLLPTAYFLLITSLGPT